jgi:hypothetical protein
MKRNINFVVAGTLLAAGFTLAPHFAQAQDRQDSQGRQDRQDHGNASATYHDKTNNDDHQWNSHEDQAYRIYQRDHHRNYVEFGRLKPRDQQNYWNWRHKHSDARLKIDIR